jgi:predicted nucleotidyltransferase
LPFCQAWAARQRELTRVYFYGSRVWGTPRPDSDLDVLIVAHPDAVICSEEEWSAELSSLLEVPVHLNDHFTVDPELLLRIKAEGLLVYSRHDSEADFEFEDEFEEFDLGSN